MKQIVVRQNKKTFRGNSLHMVLGLLKRADHVNWCRSDQKYISAVYRRMGCIKKSIKAFFGFWDYWTFFLDLYNKDVIDEFTVNFTVSRFTKGKK